MNIHAIVDNIAMSISAFALRNYKFFGESITSPSIAENLTNTTLQMPKIEGQGIYEVSADTLVGKFKPAFHITQWKGEDYPTIIYHHGYKERPFDFRWFSPNTYKNLFLSTKPPIHANLIALSAPFHRLSLREYLQKLGRLSNFVAMLSVSVTLIEHLVSYFKQWKSGRVLVSGISLGGWITNIHRAYYNTADVYVPLLAGAALGEIFISSIYHKMVGRLAQENPEVLRNVLNFEDEFRRVDDDNVYPLLARYDQIIHFDRQRVCYEGHAIKTLEKGHITASLAYDDLRTHILTHL